MRDNLYLRNFLLWLVVAGAGIALVGCGATTNREQQVERRTRTVLKEVRQEIVPATGEIVELSKTTTTVTDEITGTTETEKVTVDPPKVVGQVAALVGAVATAAGGPAAGKAAEVATDWLTTLITGSGAAAVAGGTGYMAVRKQRSVHDTLRDDLDRESERADRAEKRLRQLIFSIEKARKVLPKEVDSQLLVEMQRRQDDDLQAHIKEITG